MNTKSPTHPTRRPHRACRRGGLATLAVLLGGLAMAANAVEPAAQTKAASVPVAAVPAPSAPAPQVALPEMSQAALLEHQAKHADHLFVLDVRSPEEFREGHVPGAVNVPDDQIAARIAEVPKDKDVVLYCRSGRRAGIAADVLTANGYTRLSHLEGDMQAWVAQGRPVVEGP
jgi:rhodanese-related sulfurtransferase